MRARLARLVLVLPLLTAGCGISPAGPESAGAPASGVHRPGARADAGYTRLYFVGPYGPRSASRSADSPLGPQQALDLLLEGPTSTERARGLTSEIPSLDGKLTATAAKGAVDVYLPVNVNDLQVAAVNQLTCTAAHAEVPGSGPATRVRIRFHEPAVTGTWTVRCDGSGNARPVSRS